jgi:glycosyltransferase involved in cell wall biosynthesis
MSEIALIERDGVYWTLDLWAQDLQAQSSCVESVTLFSPVVHKTRDDWVLLPVPPSIRVVPQSSDPSTVEREIAATDVLQIPGNFTWRRSGGARAFMRIAHRLGKPVILGISSDRATTLVVNARGQHLLRRARARLGSLSIRISQRYLAARCDGTFVVGEGLRRLVESVSPNVFVGTASWIRRSDILPSSAVRRDPTTIRLCVAARLEPMKGVGLALEALASLAARGHGEPRSLLIAGRGAEEQSLRAKSLALGLDDVVTFAGSFSYPGPFLELLRHQDIVVLTNLNDEQPRLVFDAISQGCLIVCPDSVPYRALGIPADLLYRRGDANALAAALERIMGRIGETELQETLKALAIDATIESMHQKRCNWVRRTLLSQATLASGAA